MIDLVQNSGEVADTVVNQGVFVLFQNVIFKNGNVEKIYVPFPPHIKHFYGTKSLQRFSVPLH